MKYWLLSTVGERHEDRLPIKIFPNLNWKKIKEEIVRNSEIECEDGEEFEWTIEKSNGDYGLGYEISLRIKGNDFGYSTVLERF